MRPRRPSRGRQAFTAPEMLIVIFIISLLLAFIVVAVRGIRGGAQEKATRAIVTALVDACKAYFDAWNHYPPDNFADLGVPEPPRHQELRDQGDTELVVTVTGGECLVIALASRKLGGPFHEFDAEGLCDQDQDQADTFPHLREPADGWGKAIRYENLGDTIGVRLLSAGKDMLFGTGDDYKNR